MTFAVLVLAFSLLSVTDMCKCDIRREMARHLFALGGATTQDNTMAKPIKAARHLEAVKVACEKRGCTYARKPSIKKFREYLKSTNDNVCECTCPSNGDHLLHEAAQSSSSLTPHIFRDLVKENCDIDSTDDLGNTPLHEACGVSPCNGWAALVRHVTLLR